MDENLNKDSKLRPKINLSKEKVKMPHQPPLERNKNFEEVSLGYNGDEARKEAERCLNCKDKPCMKGCPVNVKIPEFISLINSGDFEGAYQKIKETNALPAVCGRVCPQETQCEATCVRKRNGEAVAIGRLERFVADFHRTVMGDKKSILEPEPAINNGHNVAVVGSGPAGLSCAGELNSMGYNVTVFEALHIPGGVLSYGIPEFRLPKSIVSAEINDLKQKGVKFNMNTVIGRTFLVDELLKEEKYEAVFVGSGAGLPSFMNIEGEGLNNVYSANEFLTRVNLMKAYKENYDTPIRHHKNVAVVGGGNVAMDAARCAKRLGAEQVFIIYRRGEEEMPARREEVEHAKEEGIILMVLNNPVKIIDDGKGSGIVQGVECIKMELGEPDSSGRRSPIPIEGSNFILEIDAVIMSIGTSPNPLLNRTTPGLSINRKGCLIVDETGVKTTKEGVYAGGDAVTGAATVILAMGAGKQGALEIDKYIKAKNAQ